MSQPLYGRRSDPYAAPECPRHPGVRSVDYCKRCNRPMCTQCVVPTEVRSICVDCAGRGRGNFFGRSRAARPRQVGNVRIGAETPLITYATIILCIGLWLGDFAGNHIVTRYLGFTPLYGLIQPWRILTTAYLHLNLTHLAFNMISLYAVGRALEPLLGRARFFALYLISALGGSIGVLGWALIDTSTVNTVTVGASGAIFGLFGAVFVLQRAAGIDARAIAGLLAVNLLYGFIVSGISWQAHIGGLIAGMLCAWVLLLLGRPRAGMTAKKQGVRTAIGVAGMFAAEIVILVVTYMVLIGI